jgi:phosphatidylglycerophosphate synthase
MNGARVQKVQRDLLLGLLAQVVLLAVLTSTGGLGAVGWVAGLASGAVTCASVRVALTRHERDRLGPADRVTLVRAVLTGGVLALVLEEQPDVTAVVGLACLALVLDRVDGEVARRTGTVSRFGAAFDMEVDAFLILVLSVHVAQGVGPWVLLIGLARYVLWLAARLWPWLREAVPPRPWAKIVAAVQGVVLTVAAAAVLPSGWTVTLLVGALVLLAESFGHQVWWLRSHRPVPAAVPVGATP